MWIHAALVASVIFTISRGEALGQSKEWLPNDIRVVNCGSPCELDEANGRTWDTAYWFLADALEEAQRDFQIREIWVARGVYFPDENRRHPEGTDDPTASVHLRDGLRIRGGFIGGELDPIQHDPWHNVTVISGAIGKDIRSHHVVMSVGTTTTAVLDGFTIRDGDARNAPAIRVLMTGEEFAPPGVGGGLLIVGGPADAKLASPTIVNCIFTNNRGSCGSAVYVERTRFGPAHIEDCRFIISSEDELTDGAIAIADGDSTTCINDEGHPLVDMEADSPAVRLINCRFQK